MIGISIAAGATAMWLASLPADQLHHFQMDPTEFAQHAPETFAQERNVEIDTSIAAVEAQRARERFAEARNAEIEASIAAVEAQRFAQARNAEVDASIAAVEAQRARETFAQARSAEFGASMATTTIPWVLPIVNQQEKSFKRGDGPEQPWQP